MYRYVDNLKYCVQCTATAMYTVCNCVKGKLKGKKRFPLKLQLYV